MLAWPGSELKLLLLSYGISPKSDCKCEDMLYQMNLWGVEGCLKHRDEIVTHLIDEGKRIGAVVSLASKLSSGWFVDEAIRRAGERLNDKILPIHPINAGDQNVQRILLAC
jgi:hypothetical protein